MFRVKYSSADVGRLLITLVVSVKWGENTISVLYLGRVAVEISYCWDICHHGGEDSKVIALTVDKSSRLGAEGF